MNQSAYDADIINAAEAFRLDVNLIRAIVAIESSYNPKATRFEKDWKYFFHPREFADKLGIPLEEEEKNQATSFGLMQVMVAVTRELGFNSRLEGLLVPQVSLYYGCKKLKRLFCSKMCDGAEEKVVAAYNAGSPRITSGGMFENQVYVDKVFRVLRELRKLK